MFFIIDVLNDVVNLTGKNLRFRAAFSQNTSRQLLLFQKWSFSLICFRNENFLKVFTCHFALRSHQVAKKIIMKGFWETFIRMNLTVQKFRGSEFTSYKIELRNRVTQNNIMLRVSNSKIFTEIFLLRYQLDLAKH